MSDVISPATTLAAEGRFREALAALNRSRRGAQSSMSVTERLELAELSERTGELTAARGHLSAIRKLSRLSDRERARWLLVDGLLSKQMGHLEESIRAFQQACRLAERAGSPELLCWCQLRLLGVSADLGGAALDESLLTHLQGNTERAAVPAVSVAYQVILAEYHAKRGDLDASRRHSSLAESLLATYPNIWLRGLLDLHLSCLTYLEGNYLDSLLAARHALATSSESGHLLTGLIAQADMAAAYLAAGQPDRARACLSSALRLANREEQIFGLLLETLAEAQLISGDLLGCSESLRCAHDLSSRLSQSRSVWHRAWNLRTEARLLQRTGRWQESLSLIRSSGTRESFDARPFTETQIEALEALALAKMGRSDEARVVVQRLVQEILLAPKWYQGSILGASAALSAVAGGRDQSLSGCAHALRILGATGETGTVVQIVDQLIELVSQKMGRPNGPEDPATLSPSWRPTSIVCHLDALTAVFSPPGSECESLVEFVNSLADLTADPVAIGEEALRYLASKGWIKRGSVVQGADGKRRTLVSYGTEAPRQPIEALEGEGPLDRITVPLGSKQSNRYDLHVAPKASDNAAASCYGIMRLLSLLRAANVRESLEARLAGRSDRQPHTEDSEGVFRSPAMLVLIASVKRIAPLDISVLLTGESGTGKEIVANIIHRASGLPQDAFVAFNCATVPRDMVDSQLFGYRRGAFTGAVQGFGGVISATDGGTLLLDEVGELPLDTQPKLLRFLDSGEIQALGEATPRKVRVRVIAATNANLESLVQQGRFREDLYYRLNVVRFRLPPLRERREEIGPLVSVFLTRYSAEFGKHKVRLSDAAREHLLLYSWPGNVRQLSHEIRRLVALSEPDSVIDVDDLDGEIRRHLQRTAHVPVPGSPCITVRIDRKLSEIVQQIEYAAIGDAIRAANGRLDLAAKRLGLSRKGLYLKRQRLGLT
jgi:DNA-binding NtrC family response regulator/tetratricopeptide (TPR) repeat protein